MKIRFYFDEDAMDADLMHALRIRGVEVTSALEQGMIRRPDSEHLAFATSQGCVLYSFNVGDFQRLHYEALTQGKHHAGIVLGQQQKYSLGEQMRRLLNIAARISAEAMRDNLVYLRTVGWVMTQPTNRIERFRMNGKRGLGAFGLDCRRSDEIS